MTSALQYLKAVSTIFCEMNFSLPESFLESKGFNFYDPFSNSDTNNLTLWKYLQYNTEKKSIFNYFLYF